MHKIAVIHYSVSVYNIAIEEENTAYSVLVALTV